MNVPLFQITYVSGQNLGRCYNQTNYEVISNKPLNDDDWKYLKERFFSCGQEFGMRPKNDGQEINVQGKYRWAYVVWVRCDSSD